MNMHDFNCIAPTNRQQTRFAETPKYQEGLYDLGQNCFAWMVPNGSWGESNAGLIIGDGESLLIDTLWDIRFTQEMLDAMKTRTEPAPITTLINTHADGDHFFGNQLLPDVDSITSEASQAEMLVTEPRSMLLLRKIGKMLSAMRLGSNARVGHWFQGMGAPYHFEEVIHTPAKRTFSGEMTLTIGGREVQLIEVGPAHTLGDLLVYIPDAKLLFAADILFIGSTPVMWAGPVENWLAALDKIDSLDVETIVPGHGPITDKNGVAQVRAYWQFVEEQSKQRFRAGMSAKEAAFDIVQSDEFQQRPFAHWNSPERMMVNVHTMYRHLNGRTDHPKIPELLKTLRQQAILAHALPNAQPTIMRKK